MIRNFLEFLLIGLLWCSISAAGDTPASKVPPRLFNVWARCLADLETPEGKHAWPVIARWEANRLDARLPICSALTGVVVNDRLVYRDLHQFRVADLATGKILASYDYNFPFAKGSAFARVFAQQVGQESRELRQLLISNSFNGLLSSDANHVYFNESAGFSFTRALARVDVAQAAQDSAPAWRLRTPQKQLRETVPNPDPATFGQSFFGVPLLADGRLYCVSLHSSGEFPGTLFANCFDAQSRELVWRRELSSDVKPSDQSTSYAMCWHEGLVIFQTESEQLRGLDAQTGNIAWRYEFPTLASQYRTKTYGSGCPNLPIVAQGRVLHLPMFGDALHCVDTRTGQGLWRVPRDETNAEFAAEYLAAVIDDTVIVVSRKRCRALSLSNGEERWQRALPAIPSGRGVLIGRTYVLPLGRSPLLAVDVSNGQATELAWPIPDSIPGNLLTSGEFIISIGRTEVRVVSGREPKPEPSRSQFLPTLIKQAVVSIVAGEPPIAQTEDPNRKLAFKVAADRGQLVEAQTEKPTGVSVTLKGTRIDMPITCWAFSPDGKLIAVGIGWKKSYLGGTEDNFGNVAVFDVGTGETILTTNQRMGFVHKVGFSKDGRTVNYQAERFQIDGP